MQYRLTIEYDGTAFHGWQIQAGARTVQGVLEQALATLLGEATRVAAAGRTDAGVHACGQVVTFRTERAIAPAALRRAVDALTPHDVAVSAAEPVADDFDVRRAARSRVYAYRIWNRASASPFWRPYAWHVPWTLDEAAMQRAASQVLGEHDFSSFRAAGCDAAHPLRRVVRSAIERRGDLLVYEIEATAFLRHMVRNIVGTLVEIGGRRRNPDLAALLAARDRTQAGATAPPHGLCLIAVRY